MKRNFSFPWQKHATQLAPQDDVQLKVEGAAAATGPTVLDSRHLQQVSGGAKSTTTVGVVATTSLPRGGGW